MDRIPVVIVDDDEELCTLLSKALEREEFTVTAVHDANTGLDEVLSDRHKLVILDIMLPGGNGLDVLKEIREKSRVPVVMLTARGEERDRIKGLEIGADDYLPKPFSTRELMARMRAVLRRIPQEQDVPRVITVGDVDVDTSKRTVRQNGKDISLTGAEFDILVLLLLAQGKTISRDELSEKALGRQVAFLDRSIDMHVSNLRKKLGTMAGSSERIKSIRGAGYVYTGCDPA